MWTFVVRVSAFLLIQGALFSLFWNPNLPDEDNYLAATIDKHNRLKSSPPGRIVLVGGSNLAFGINSEILARELSRPVVNMGLNAALGVQFMLNEVEREIKSGDVIVLSFEYDILGGIGVELVLRQLLELRPRSWSYLALSRWKRMSDVYGFSVVGGVARRALLGKWGHRPSPTSDFGSYRRKLFDESGSYVGHYGMESLHPEFRKVKILEISEANRDRIGRFADQCRRLGASCVFVCPPHPAMLLNPLPSGIEHNLRVLSEIPSLKLLNRPGDEALPEGAFFDTCYHLVGQAGKERTRRLVEELRPFCAGEKAQRAVRTAAAAK